METTKLKTVDFKKVLIEIMDEDALSPEALVKKSGASKATIYAILNERYKTTQRLTAKQIVESTGRKLEIQKGKLVYFKTGQKGDAQENDIFTKEPPELDFDNPERMSHQDRQRLIEYINETAFKGKMSGDIKDIFDRLLKESPKLHKKFNGVLKIFGS